MKTVIISQKDLKDTTSGVPRKVHQEIQLLHTMGHKVEVIAETIDSEAVIASGGIPIKTFRWPISGYSRRAFYNWQVERRRRQKHADLVIGHGDILVQDLCYIHNCVHLAYERIHNSVISQNHQVAKIHSQILKNQQFKFLICNSKLMQDDLTLRFNIPIDKTRVIHPEVDLVKFNTKDRENGRKQIRKQYNINDNHFLIGLVTSGNFKKRNVQLLLHAMKELIDHKHKEIRLLIAGKNKESFFHEMVNQLELGEYVIFAPSIKKVESYYHALDLFVLPALIEEFGRSALEAMACGTPILLSSWVGSSEIIEEFRQESILENLELSSLVESILAFAKNPQLCQKCVEVNLKTASLYSAEKQNQKLLHLVEENFPHLISK